jgi:hypothetical protein
MRVATRALLALSLIALAGRARAASPPDEFFLISSLDLDRGTIVVKRPTEVTLLLYVDSRTRCLAENGRPMALSKLRAGDTVYVVSERDASGRLLARTVREGVMTVPELRRRYLRPAG